MKKTVLEWRRGSYLYKKSNNHNVAILGDFLSIEVGCEDAFMVEKLIGWVSSNDEDWYGRRMEMEKEDDLILVSDDYVYALGVGSIDCFETSKSQFIQILNRWREICLQKPKEIIISQGDGGQISLVPNNDVFPEAALHFRDNGYIFGRFTDQYLGNLAFFFSYDFEGTSYKDVFSFKKWFSQKGKNTFFDGRLKISKNNGVLSIAFDKEEDPGYRSFVIDENLLFDLIDSFELVSNFRSKTIIITKKNGKIIICEEEEI